MIEARYWRDIAAVLTVKAAAFGLLYVLFFSSVQPAAPAAAMAQHLSLPMAPIEMENDRD